ncbi:hypothetical protein AMELA_G00234890 [Ameiurus melas]|uniref:Uncharacterized protein n=1 Tax=Ameiurus melas TaxID=219545 RepID=A0A7J6A0M6_AMEME|nr:hypothetical protein AMELA_G00234890 [Ameiurus melas]
MILLPELTPTLGSFSSNEQNLSSNDVPQNGFSTSSGLSVHDLRSKRQKKKADEGDYQNVGPSSKDDTYAALDLAGRTSDDVYHTLAISHPSPPADTPTSSDYWATLRNMVNELSPETADE